MPHSKRVSASDRTSPAARARPVGAWFATRPSRTASSNTSTRNPGPSTYATKRVTQADRDVEDWDPSRGSPDFVTEAPVHVLPRTPRAMASVHRYVRNVALWLAGRDS